MTWNGSRPVRCQLCGEWFPDADAAWDHQCEVWERLDEEERARSRPVLPQYRTIAHHVDRYPLTNPWRRLITWGTRHALGPDATLLDALQRAYSPRKAERMARRIRAQRAR